MGDEEAMIRKAFVMGINAHAADEYTKRHLHNYSIFLLKETLQLFAYVEIESAEQWSAIAATSACQQWWHHMADLMPHNPDSSPLTTPLTEVFHLD
jgi:L-rhamnose mutarotase